MPVVNINCCLCGAPVDETQPWPEWMGRFRAVCTLDEQWTSAFVSGVGQRHRFNDLVPSPVRLDSHGTAGSEEGVTLSIETPDSIEEETMEIDICSSQCGERQAVGPGQRIWGFPFHFSCWDLLIAHRSAHGVVQYEPQTLFDVLRSFPRHRLSEFGHDYGGVAGWDIELDLFDIVDPSHEPCHLLPGEEPRLVYDRTNRALLQMQRENPMCATEISSIFRGERPSGGAVSEAHSGDYLPSFNTRYSEPFGKLPTELLQFIISELPSPDVIALKQSSRVFQRLPLPETFWRSRFLRGREFDYIFEALSYFENCHGQWRTIFQYFRDNRKSPSLMNRRRVWRLAQTLDDFVEKRLESRICSGTVVRSYFEPNAPDEKNAIWTEAHRCLRPFNQDFPTGCRELYVRTMLVPPNATDIYVSVVDILDKTYVSGLRFGEPRGTIQQIGYVRPGNETLLTWNTPGELLQATGLQLALDQHGVRGLCIVSGENALSGWAGQHEGVPKRRLVLAGGKEYGITKLKGGFDALKLVSLSLSTHDRTSTESPVTAIPSLRDTALWFPDIPEPRLSFSGITTEALRLDDPEKHQRPLTMLIFGARERLHLSNITHLAVLTQEDFGVIGLEVTYKNPLDGENSRLLGSNKPCIPFNRRPPPETLRQSKMSFETSAGEELTALDVLQGHCVLCLKFHTSLGRVVELPPPDDSELDMETRAEDEGELISIKPDSGKVVGFFARAGSKGLQNLGLVHVELPEKDSVKL